MRMGWIVTAAAGLGWLALATGAGAQPGEAGWSREPGGLLPLQDRVGQPRIARAVEGALRTALAERHALVEPERLRDGQRRLRLRDTSQAAPESLVRLGELAGAEWLFAATLHQAVSGRASRASRAYVTGRASGPVPQIILSARAVHLSAEVAELGWAGFEAASGLDERRLLGLGVVGELEALAEEMTLRLVETFERDVSQGTAWAGGRPARGGYLRRPIDAGATVAVVPFHSVTERDATLAGETVTELAHAVLYRSGAHLVLPGLVSEVLRQRGSLLRGEIDAQTRRELQRGGAELILTGTVEAWELLGNVTEPEPHVGFSARLLDAESGAILWWNGQDRRGWDRSRALGLGRVHAAGALAEEVMASLVASFMEGANR